MAREKLTKTEGKARAERMKKFFADKENNPDKALDGKTKRGDLGTYFTKPKSATSENNPDKDLEEKALDKRKEFMKQSHMNRFPTGLASGGLARKKRKSDGGLKVGKRKIAKGCGKVQRRKKTLYT